MVTNGTGQISFHAHQDGGLLFNGADRQLYGLDPVSGYCWLELNEGQAEADIADALVATFQLEEQTAREWVDRLKDQFDQNGLLACDQSSANTQEGKTEQTHVRSLPASPHTRVSSHPCQSFDLSFIVWATIDDLQRLAPLLAPLSSALSDTRLTRFTIVEEKPGFRNVFIDETLSEADIPVEHLITVMEGIIQTQALRQSDYLIALHCALVSRTTEGQGGLILAGESGSGKSTLSIAMSESGWVFGSDDLSILTRDLTVRPAGLNPCVKDGALDIIECYHPSIRSQVSFDRFGRNARYDAEIKQRCQEATVLAVIFPTYAEGAETQLERLDGGEGLQKLLAQCLNVSGDFSHGEVALLAAWHDRLDYYALPFDTPDAAIRVLDAAFPGTQ
ncbi:MAG: PqqD family peptide modification chaperone [Pseudomonadota bacterium]